MAIERNIPRLIRAALSDDKRTVRNIALQMIKQTKKDFPKVSAEIADAVAHYSVGSSSLRSINIEPPPVDQDSRSLLIQVQEACPTESPVFNKDIQNSIDLFINERLNSNKLLQEGLRPSGCLLLTGPPGVGKTHLTQYLSYKLDISLATYDLATSVSSYLGRTGQNLRAVFDYAKNNPCLLFLDEFDAIAKKRDDHSDLGELKRLVNILLKELEAWPHYSVLVAATNHPELLDRAIWRRFDIVLDIPLPSKIERFEILNQKFLKFKKQLNPSFLSLISELLQFQSGSDICQYAEKVNRALVITEGDIKKICLDYLKPIINNGTKMSKAQICKNIHKYYPSLSLREIGNIVGLSHSTVHHHIKGGEK